jgi:hypothetical protein
MREGESSVAIVGGGIGGLARRWVDGSCRSGTRLRMRGYVAVTSELCGVDRGFALVRQHMPPPRRAGGRAAL